MKVLFDNQAFDMQKIGGISRYFNEIISNFPGNNDAIIGVKYTENEYLAKNKLASDYPKNTYESFLNGIHFRGKKKLFRCVKTVLPAIYGDNNFINQHYSIKLLKEGQFDVFHPTYYSDYFFGYITNKPFVITIHDMMHELYPEFYDKKDKTPIIKKYLASELINNCNF